MPGPPRAADRGPGRWRAAAVTAIAAVVAAASGAVGVSPAAAAPAGRTADYTSLVDPFVSTSGDDGNDLPGAQAPNGIVKVNPLTVPGRNHTGYDYRQTHIAGFTQTNLDGVGGSGGGGDILVVPTEVEYGARPSTGSYAHPFTHDHETAAPGYYRVRLGEISGRDGAVVDGPGAIDAEVTATTRTALHRYAFPDGATPELVVDLNHNFTSRTGSSVDVQRLGDGRVALSGDVDGSFNGAAYALHYHAETEQPVASFATWGPGGFGDAASRRGTDTGAVLRFAPEDAGAVGLRITVSPISADQARIDQRAEVGSLSFDGARAQTRAVWNARLGSVDVSASVKADPDGTLRRLFYTHLYRMFALPVNATSTSGTYRGVDGVVHRVDDVTYYDGWSSWDDFRKYSVIALVDPEMYRDMVQSLVFLFADVQGTGKAIGGLTHSVPTVRWERSAVIVADALSKGFTGFERLDQAYPALKSYVGFYDGNQLRQGYIEDRPGDSVQRGYDQWALATIADALGRADEAQQLRAQAALPIANLYKAGAWTAPDGTQVGLLTPRDAAGAWGEVDHARFEAANLYQGTLWQYTWYPAYDMDGVVAAMGGPEAARRAVVHFMGADDPDNGLGMLHSNANEIDLQAPYLFNYVGLPSLTQHWVRTIYTKESWNRYLATGGTDEYPSGGGELRPPLKTRVYRLDPRGFLPTMDNDAGTMSTMFVAAAIGLFPVTAGSSQFQIGSPFFDSTTIAYADGRRFTVAADGVSADSYYVQSASLNGAAFGNTWLDYRALVDGGSLNLRMGATPSGWGASGAPAYSMSTAGDGGGGTPSGSTVHASSMTIAARADGTVDGAIELTLGGGARFAGRRGTDHLATGAATMHGLPAGVSAKVVVANPTTVRVVLSGSTTTGARCYVTFTDAAFAGRVPASRVTGDGLSSRTALSISVAAAERATLRQLVDEGVLVRQGNYSFASYHAFRGALERAGTVLADGSSTTATLRAAAESLDATIAALALDQGGYRVLEAEDRTADSGNGLKSEQSTWDDGTHVTNLGATYDGAWLDYGTIDFGTTALDQVSVHYVNNAARCGQNSAIDVHLDAFDPAAPGAPFVTIPLPVTGSAWQNAATTTAPLPRGLAGSHRLVLRLRTTPDSSHPYVANIDNLTFATAPAGEDPPGGDGPADTSALTAAIADAAAYTGDEARYGSIDFGVFARELDRARAIAGSGTATRSEVDAQTRALRLAFGQLTPRARLLLENTVERAGSVEQRRYTEASWGALTGALDAARTALADEAAGDATLSQADAALTGALNGLTVKPGEAPATPAAVSIANDASSVTVRWSPGDDGGSPVTGFVVALDDGHELAVRDAAQTSAVFTRLRRGTAARARVRAVNALGASPWSAFTEPVVVGASPPKVAGANAAGTSTTPASTVVQRSGDASTATAPGPFPPEVLSARYDSDSWPATPDGGPTFVNLLRGFPQLGTDVRGANARVADLAMVSAYNDTKALEINRSASIDQVKRAENDADHGSDLTMADGLGSRLGGLYLQARGDGRLPKTDALFGRITSGIDGTDAAKSTYAYLRPYVRMGLVGEGGLVRDSSNGSYGGLAGDGSFPSGHTYGGYTAGTFLATLLPELAPQILARTSEYGDNRIVLGFHYPLDVMGSRMTGQATLAHRWADPAFEDLLMQAHDEIESVLLDACRAEGFGSLPACAGQPYRGLDADQAESLYTARLSYGFPRVGQPGVPANVPDEAGALLTTAFPDLTNAQRVQILEQTALDSGFPLDLTAAGDPSWQRINLARAMTARVQVNDDGTVTVTNHPDDTRASVATAASLTVDGVAVDGFDPGTQTYLVDWPRNRRLPTVAVRPTEAGARVSASTGRDGTRVLTVTSANGEITRRYTVAFFRSRPQ